MRAAHLGAMQPHSGMPPHMGWAAAAAAAGFAPELPQPGQRVLGHVAVHIVALGQVLGTAQTGERRGKWGAGQQ